MDHGKTCLTRALTGVDTDRLKEEQKRGITIEIGFAQLTLPNGQTASIIDVPGHEKFIRNMLVGAAGMDVVLMVIAADEGFMPQTREHLGILSLLGVQNGIIVVTKADMVDAEWLEAIEEEARETVRGTFLQDAPILAVSSYTGQGIEELKELIVQLVEGAEQRNQDRPFRLPVDRVFSVDGFGTVVTGTLLEGSMQLGEEVCIYPGEKKARIRGLQTTTRRRSGPAPACAWRSTSQASTRRRSSGATRWPGRAPWSSRRDGCAAHHAREMLPTPSKTTPSSTSTTAAGSWYVSA